MDRELHRAQEKKTRRAPILDFSYVHSEMKPEDGVSSKNSSPVRKIENAFGLETPHIFKRTASNWTAADSWKHTLQLSSLTLKEIPETTIEDVASSVQDSVQDSVDDGSALFCEDSPFFRQKLLKLGNRFESLCRCLDSLVSKAKVYEKLGEQFRQAGEDMAEELNRIAQMEENGGLGDLTQPLSSFGEMLVEVHDSWKILLHTFHSAFTEPMENFVKHEKKMMQNHKKEYLSTRDEYEDSISKFLSLKKGTDPIIVDSKIADLEASKQRFELSRFDYVSALSKAEHSRDFQLVESIVAGQYSFVVFFHQCHEFANEFNPSLQHLQFIAQEQQLLHSEEAKEWDDLRVKLKQRVENADLNKQLRSPSERTHSYSISSIGSEDRRWSSETSPTGDIQRITKRSMSQSLALQIIQRIADGRTHPGVIKQGYLQKRGFNFMRTWQRRWFYIEGGKIGYLREGETEGDLERVDICEILLCNVRACPTAELKWCFQIVSPNSRTYLLQAESLQDMEDWIESIKLYHEAILQAQIISRTSAKSQKTRSFSTQSASMSVAANPIRPRSETDTAVISNSTNSISKRASYTHSIYHTSKLGGVEVVQESETKDEIGGENNVASKSIRTSTRRNSHEIYESLHRLQSANSSCADCGRSNPDWAVINFGILVCIECSGIHRSLGVHISKVRSLTLDLWEVNLVDMMLSLGNDKINEIFENVIQPGWQKPRYNSLQDEKSKWITAKYKWKGFISDDSSTTDELGSQLQTAAREGDLLRIVWLLAHGASPSYTSPTENSTPLEIARENGHTLCSEFIYHNGGFEASSLSS